MRIINSIKKIISIFFFVILLNNIAFAAQDSLTSEEQASKSSEVEQTTEDILKINTLDELQQDLSNRLILGVFGKDALIYSLGSHVDENVANEISMLSMEDVQEYSKPFNVGNLNGLLMILSSFFFIAFSVLAIYFGWVMFEALFNTQDSGEFFGKKTSTLFSVLKGSTAMVLIIPAYGFSHSPFSDFKNATQDGESYYGSFSIAQLFVFTSMGYSNQFANHIWGSFINNYQRSYPGLKLPNRHSKEQEMNALLEYIMCVKSYNNDGEFSNLTFQRTSRNEGSFILAAKYENCEISGKVKYDYTLIQSLKEDSELTGMINGVVDYESVFIDVITNTLTNSVNRSIKYADLLLKEAGELTTATDRTSALVNANNWEQLCDTPEAMYKAGELNTASIPVVKYYMSKCLSDEYILSFVSGDKLKAKEYYNQNIFVGNKIDLCDEQSAQDNGNRTFVNNGDSNTNDNNISKTMEQCLMDTCGKVNSGESGLYQCATAISFAKTNAESERMIKQGWLNAGAYSYALFSGFTNNGAQEIINSLTLNFDKTETTNMEDVEEDDSDIHFAISSKNVLEEDVYSDFEKVLNNDIDYYSLIEDAKKESMAIASPAKSFGGDDGLFGIYKFTVCSSSPSSITGGFACGNITEEMHEMGAKMLALGIEIQLAQSAGKIFKQSMKIKGSMSKAMGSLKNKASKLSPEAVGYIRTIAILTGIGGTGYAGFQGSSAFNDLDSYWTQSPEMYYAVIAIFSGTIPYLEPLADIVKGLLFILGIIFGFLLPLLPYFLWITVVSGWAVMILESLIVAPVWAATLISPSNDHTSRTAKKGLLILLTIVMRAPFMVIGLVLAWTLSNSLIGSLLEISDLNSALLINGGTDSLLSGIDTFVKLIVYLSLVYFIYNLVFSIIEGFYEIGSNWLFNSSLSPFSSKDRSENWRSGYSSAKKYIGVK